MNDDPQYQERCRSARNALLGAVIGCACAAITAAFMGIYPGFTLGAIAGIWLTIKILRSEKVI